MNFISFLSCRRVSTSRLGFMGDSFVSTMKQSNTFQELRSFQFQQPLIPSRSVNSNRKGLTLTHRHFRNLKKMSSLSQVLILPIPDFEGFSKNQDCSLVKGTFPYLLFMFLLYTIQLKVEGRSNDWMSWSCSRKESFMICKKRSCILMLSKLLRLPSQSQLAILSANIICPCFVMSSTEETLELATESRYTLKSISLT